MYAQDTIAAIATPAGSGGIGIIKLSGPRALQIITGFFRSASMRAGLPESHRLHYGRIIDPDDNAVLDEALVAYMRSPASHTGEDVVEINCHSGWVLLQRVLDLAIRHGARLAEPGEFTKRAFLNGRIDLTQAEAVIDMIDAQSETALKAAARQVHGHLARELQSLRAALLEVAAAVDALIDFPEEHFDDISAASLHAQVASTAGIVLQLIAAHQQTALYRAGVQAVIVGKPNVGKSSLLNTLLGTPRAIVTPIPGTTRDMIRETLSINNVPVHLHDTAGIRPAGDQIEHAGIALALQKMSEADIVLLVLDGSAPLDEHDQSIIGQLCQENVLAVINKADLPPVLSAADVRDRLPSAHIVRISALLHQGIGALMEACAGFVTKIGQTSGAHSLSVQTRQRLALESMLSALTAAADGLNHGRPLELVAVDLRTALDSLGQLTGETITETILDTVFSRFCIGK